MKEALPVKQSHRRPHPRRHSPQPVDHEQALALIRVVLDGRELPMAVRQLERRLDLGPRTLIYHFPQQCALISDQYRAYRSEQARQRREQGHSKVRQATLALYAEGINPSARHVAGKLPDAGVMRTPEGLTTWHRIRRELGLEQ